jgi:hypothetical protein
LQLPRDWTLSEHSKLVFKEVLPKPTLQSHADDLSKFALYDGGCVSVLAELCSNY